jgi:hypothetical protein
VVTLRARSGVQLDTQRTHRGLLGLIGALRLAIGVAGFARPGALGRFTGLDRVTSERTAFLTRMAAARDVALGVGQLTAAGRRTDASSTCLWALAGALADAGDTAALADAAARGRIAPLRGGLLTLSAAGAVAVAGQTIVSRVPAASPDPASRGRLDG